MRIGIDALWLLPGMVGGAETYLRGLLSGLSLIDQDNEYLLFTNRDNHSTFTGLGANFRKVLYDRSAKWDIFSLAMLRGVGEQGFLPRRAARERVEVLHASLDIVPFGARCPTVVTIHDLNFEAVHESASAVVRRISEAMVRRSARRAGAVLTVSEFSRVQICSLLGLPRGKVRVAYNAPALRPRVSPRLWPALAAKWGIARPYLLALSSLNPHKNIGALLLAYARLAPALRPRLAVVGHLPRLGEPLPELARRLGVGPSVLFTGYLIDAEMRLMLENAHALIFPSLYEGFGLPVVEAMAAGVPVACSKAASLPEVARGAALFFDPRSIGEMAACLERLIAEPGLRESLIAAGRVNARRFSWESTARRTLDVYRSLAPGSSARAAAMSELAG